MNTFYITTPIYYANSLPHLGHLYTTTVADAVRRYKRQRGFETFFLTGTDEHGVNIQRAAEQNDRTPKQQVDYVAGELKKMFRRFGLDTEHGGYDIFMRTTNEFHYESAKVLWTKIAKSTTPKGRPAIYKGFYEAWFCAPCAEFKTETEYVAPQEGDVPLCVVHETPLDRVEEESYFFRLSDYAETLLEQIDADPGLIRPEPRKNEIVSFIKGGLEDLSISREASSVTWGIPVPGDPEHVMYVWLDALSNYITALGYGREADADNGFKLYWPSAHHFIGKDILRFHTVYWFSFLMAAGISLPKCVFAHGMWLDAEGRKMSKTLGNVIEPDVLAEYFQVDAVRYFLLRDMVFGSDSKFSYEHLIDRANADLAKGLGNLTSRTLAMVRKYREGRISEGRIRESNFIYAKRAGLNPDEQELVSILELGRDRFTGHFDDFEFSEALKVVWEVIARIDKMITHSAPWKLIKDENQVETLNAVLYRSLESLRWIAVQLFPVMPTTAREIFTQMGIDADPGTIDPKKLAWGGTEAGSPIGESRAVFPRLEKDKIMPQIESRSQDDAATERVAEKKAADGVITIDDFLKVELRTAEVLEAEAVEGSDRLLRIVVDAGEDSPRQIVAGIAGHYEPADLLGRKIVIVANLKPRKLFGLESRGMLCAASVGKEGRPVLATFTEDVPNGVRLK